MTPRATPAPAPFETARLAMRALAVGDAAALHPAYRDPAVMRYWSGAPHQTLDETVDYLGPRVDSGSWRGWAIATKESGDAIGTLGATERRPGVIEIGYLIVPWMARRGYAHEAVGSLIDRSFAAGARRIFADTDPDNIPSNALLTRLGFQREGLLRGEWETHIGIRDSVIWGLLRDEWRR